MTLNQTQEVRSIPPVPSTVDGLTGLLARIPALVNEIAQGASRRDLERELPFAAFALIRQAGLGALRIPQALGGPGGSVSDYIEVIAALASADPNVAHALRSHFNFTEAVVHSPDSAEKRDYVAKILNGQLFAGAHTEVGAPLGTLATRLTRDGEGYRLNGKKWYATGSAYADYLSFSAIDDQGQLISVLLPADREGIQVLDDWDGMGQRLTASGGVLLDNVQVFADELKSRGHNADVGRHCSTLRQLHLAACAGGVVRNIHQDALGYVRKQARAAMHSPAAVARDDHFVQQVVGEIAANTYAVDALIAHTARILERSSQALLANDPVLDQQLIEASVSNAQLQVVVAKLALRSAEVMFEVGGGSATSRTYNFDRHWRNIRTVLNHNPLLHKARVVGDFYINETTTHLREGLVF
ncbi:acyl-CoA dehydrogenase family protein [Pseudomonas sp.]|uniref:acyl-CoA dehydrogenase family protein n=1 Tax=Pseudomonas sp. TaxID=306 RepID=UPI00260B98B4|nr:acyl-CoA dehydrogenase family protein [Pseudomonas sp.]